MRICLEFLGHIALAAGSKKAEVDIDKASVDNLHQLLINSFNYEKWGGDVFPNTNKYVLLHNGTVFSSECLNEGDLLLFLPLIAGG